MRIRSASSGVTLIELAITIALVGILGAIIIQFVAPVRSYIDSSRRAALADTADTALRRVRRDLHLALPNSVRVTNVGSVFYIEMLLVRTGGRYRAESDAAATNTCNDGASSVPANDILQFGAADTCFKTLGDVPNIGQVVNTDYLVVFNLQPGTDKADAYQTTCGAVCNKSLISSATDGAGSERLVFASNTFTFESPGNRFFIIEGPVSYVCDPTAKTLTRRWGYDITDAQPTATFAGAGSASALMATGVTGCTFTYDAAVSAGVGLATLALTLSMEDSRGTAENVNLYHAVHVSNVP